MKKITKSCTLNLHIYQSEDATNPRVMSEIDEILFKLFFSHIVHHFLVSLQVLKCVLGLWKTVITSIEPVTSVDQSIRQ